MTFKSAFQKVASIFRKQQPTSHVAEIPASPFVKVQHLTSNHLSNLHVLEMAKAYRLSNPEPDVFQVEYGDTNDRWSGTFKHASVEQPQPPPIQPESLADAEFSARQAKVHGVTLDLDSLFPVLSDASSSGSSSATSSPGPELDSSPSWIEYIWRTSATFDTVSVYSQLSSPSASASLSSFKDYPCASLPASVSWIHFPHSSSITAEIVESRDILMACDTSSVEDAIDCTKDVTTVVSPAPSVSAIQAHAQHVEEATKTTEPTATTTQTLTMSTSVSFRKWERGMLAQMAMSRLGDNPNAVPSEAPARFKGVERSRPAEKRSAPRPEVVALSTSESENKWLRAEGARVAMARLGDEPNAERADMPLRFPSAHPVLVAHRKKLDAYIIQTHEEAALLEDYAAELALAHAREKTDISGALFAALSEVQECVVESQAPIEEPVVSSTDLEASESLAAEPAPPLKKPKKQVRFAETLEQVRLIDARVIIPSGNKYPLRKSISKPPVNQSPAASPSKIPRASSIGSPRTTRIPPRAAGKENVTSAKIPAPKANIIAQRRPIVQKSKISAPAAPTTISPIKSKASTSAPALKRLSPPTSPTKGARKSFSASRGFLP